MPDDRWRLTLLCEDRRHERFVRRLCERYSIAIQSVEISPAGKGSASQWVKTKYAALVARRRSKNYQKNLGLLVLIDGDNQGVAARKSELDQQLQSSGLPSRSSDDAIAVFVPTWSIETWLAVLCGKGSIGEAASVKGDPAVQGLWKDGEQEADTVARAVGAWKQTAAAVQSLADAYLESGRVGFP